MKCLPSGDKTARVLKFKHYKLLYFNHNNITSYFKKTHLIDPASLPDDGSVKQKAANSLLDTLGKYLAFCSGVPNNNIPCKQKKIVFYL